MNWDDFRYLLAVAREGRFAAAGRTLGVEHTTVARRIAALESALGGPLVYRTGRGLLLTPLGESALERAESMEEAALETVTASARGGEEDPIEGRVRITMVDSFAVSWFVPRLGELWKEHPRIQVEVLTGEQPVDLARGHAELAIRAPRPQGRELTAFRLGGSAFRLYALRKVAARVRRGLAAREPRLEGVPLLVYPPEKSFLQRAPWFQQLLDRTPEQMTAGSTLSLLAAARAGLGVAVLPDFVAFAHPELVRASPRELSRLDAFLVSHPQFRRDPRVAAVAEFVKRIAPALEGKRVRSG